MRFKSSLRGLSLGCAIAFLATGAAWALPPNPPGNTADSSASWLAGATARLDRAIDSQTAKQGDVVEAKLINTMKTPEGTALPAGTELHGTVAAVKASQNGGPSSISLRFDKADLKNGKSLPVRVTVIGAFPSDENQLSVDGQASMAPVEKHVSLKDRFDQEAGTLSHIAMHSRASGSNSATFSNKSGDVKLRAGTFLQVGIAQQHNGGMSTGM